MEAMEEKLFRKLKDEEKNDEFIAVESRTFLQSVWHDFIGNKRAVVGAIVLIIVVLLAIFGPPFVSIPMMNRTWLFEMHLLALITGLEPIKWGVIFL